MEELIKVEGRELQLTKLYQAPVVEDLGTIRSRTGVFITGQQVSQLLGSVDQCEVHEYPNGQLGTTCIGDTSDIF